jgi:hypothetical protein
MALIPSTNTNVQRYKQLVQTVGRNAAHSLFPKDFEAYFISLELVDSNGTEAFITFPVQPNQISEISPKITNIKKTASGIVAVGTESFIPRDIEIKGNFGRSLRFVIGNNFITGDLFAFIRGKGVDIKYTNFSNQVKTGYGMVKAIESLIDSADSLDDQGRAKKLYLYNPILGNNYLVKPKNFIHSQNQSENMIPQYTIQLTAVAPLEASSLFNRLLNFGERMGMNVLNKGANELAKNVKKTLGL